MKGAKRALCLLLAALLLGLLGACAQPAAEAERPVYDELAAVPGVTAEEIEAIDALRGQYDAFVYGMNNTSEAFYAEDGSVGGFTALVCDWLGRLFDIPFEPSVVNWDELIGGLAGQRRLRYAFFSGATSLTFVRSSSEYPFDAFLLSDYDLAAELLRSGQIDAFFEDGPAEAAFDAYEDIEGHDYFPLVYAPVSLMTADPAPEPVISVVQKCLDAGEGEYLAQLYNEGYQQYRRHKFFLHLTDEELSWLEAHIETGQAIPVALEYDNYPASFYNEQEGEYQGIAIDVLAEIEDLSGLQFERVNEVMADWPEMLDMLDEGEAALITELIPSKERQGLYLWTEAPYSIDQYALLSLSEHEDVAVNQVLYSRVGLIAESAYAEVFHEWFPGMAIRPPTTPVTPPSTRWRQGRSTC